MFYKAAKLLSKTAIAFGFMCMVGGCSVEQQELFYLYEALGLAVYCFIIHLTFSSDFPII